MIPIETEAILNVLMKAKSILSEVATKSTNPFAVAMVKPMVTIVKLKTPVLPNGLKVLRTFSDSKTMVSAPLEFSTVPVWGLMDLDFVPVAVFNVLLHKKTSSGKQYSHYLIPILNNENQKSILLEDVEINSD